MSLALEYDSYRPALVRIAYGMLGSLDEAEDVAQEVLIKLLEVDRAQIRSIKSYLIRM
ncbi:MAG: RNA polymerase sigma-70 factor, partial [Ignavibacteriales bacterium]|nr:RNA polymerase sigma-70 factor [Ignavibacteriales bacterium]